MDSNDTTIAGIIAAQAARGPERVAIRAPGRDPLSYAGLDAVIASVARSLDEMGLAGTDRVALVLPNGPEMAVAFLAVASRMTCAPLNPDHRADDLAFAFADLGVKAVIVGSVTDSPAMRAAQRLSLTVIELVAAPGAPAGVFWLRLHARGSAPRPRDPDADHVALVLHTSGTTARPKIVPLTQRSLCRSAQNIRSSLALDCSDTCLNVMPLFHVHGLVGALLSSMAAGASIVCTPGLHGGDFVAWLRASRATWYTAVPTMHQAIVGAARDRARPLDAGRLRFVRSASAGLPRHVMDDLSTLFAVPVIEAYGMTEAAHQLASNPLRAGGQRPGSVGLPTGSDIAIMTASGRVVAGGVVGEIVVRGETVTRGYEANSEANRAAFVDGWLRTGDQGYFDADGYLFLTGRLKELINRGGEKIAPGEVEEALLQHPAVAQAVAFPVPHARLGEEVGAAVVLRPGARTPVGELRQAAQDRLPYFKTPRLVVTVDQIPMGPTGKVDRARLAASLALHNLPAANRAAPRTPLERRLTDEWTRLLGSGPVGVDDDFFDLGGDSLLAMEMILRVSALLQTDVALAEFFERPTIAGLLEIHERSLALGGGARTRDTTVAIQTAGTGVPIFCPAHHDNSLGGLGRLVRHLGKERPVYGLRVPPIDARGPVLTIEQLAERNLAEMLRLQPQGPYHLLGSCRGGVVAYEMARQLERLGHPVGLLVMIDAFNWAWRETDATASPLRVRTRHLLHRMRFHRDLLRALPMRERVAHVRARAGRFLAHHQAEAGYLAFRTLTRAGLPRPAFLQQAAHANRWARRRYRPGHYAGDVQLVRSVAPVADIYPLPRMGWGDLMRGNVTMVDLPCDKSGLWTDDRLLLHAAAAIRDALRKIEGRRARQANAETGGQAVTPGAQGGIHPWIE